MMIINKYEIKNFLDLKDDFSLCSDELIEKIERRLFRKCLGKDFYELVKSALTDTSGIDSYDSNNTYNTDDKISYKGFYYKCKEDGVSGIPPNNESKWSLLPKFQDNQTCDYNEFYCDYLGPVIAYEVFVKELPRIRNTITSEGVFSVQLGNMEAASYKDYADLASFYTSELEDLHGDMDDYVSQFKKDNESSECFELYKKFETNNNCEVVDNSICDCGKTNCEECSLESFSGYMIV